MLDIRVMSGIDHGALAEPIDTGGTAAFEQQAKEERPCQTDPEHTTDLNVNQLTNGGLCS